MKKIGQLLRRYIHPFFIVCMILIIIAGIIIIYNSRQTYASETWVQEYLQAYNDNLTELDIQVLTKNLSSQIDEKIEELDFSTELSQEQYMKLLAMVDEELQYADYSIPQEEISKISSDIVKRIISENTPEVYATSHKIDETIDELESQLLELRKAVEKLDNDEKNEINNLSEQQIREIIKETSLDEATVRNWLAEFDVFESYDTAISELAKLLEVDAGTLKILTNEAEEQENSITYLAKRLGITEERLNEALQMAGSSDNKELVELAARLKEAEDELQNQIDSNMALTTNSITSVQQQVINNKNATDTTISSSKQEMLSAIAANKAETDEQINANKEYTDAAIEELQENVLFYQYDEENNTLYLFPKETGGSDEESESN